MKPLAVMSLVTGLLLAALPATGSAQARADLEISVSAPSVARLSGDTEIVVSMTNVGNKAITLPSQPGWDAEGGLTLSITQVNGVRVNRPVQSDEPLRKPVRSRSGSKMALEAGHALDYFHVIQLGDLISVPGDYRLVVTYRRAGLPDLASDPVELVVVN